MALVNMFLIKRDMLYASFNLISFSVVWMKGTLVLIFAHGFDDFGDRKV